MGATTDEAPVLPDAIMQVGLGFWASKALLSAVELGLFTALTDGPLDRTALMHRLGLHPRAARDFLDALVALGMLERDEAGLYANTPATALYLDRTRPTYLGGILEMANARLYGFWGSLTEALQTGEPQNEAKRGGDLFAELYLDPERMAAFARAMTGISRGSAQAIADKFPWSSHGSVIDIGSAEGVVPVTMALAHPHLTGGGFDLPELRPHFERFVAANGLSDRVAFHAGDFFADPLPRADVLIMGHILHDWDLERKRYLIAKAHEALPTGGALIIYETLIDDARRQNAVGLLMSLNMLIETRGGFDYTGADCIGWLQAAGFRECRTEHLAGAESMVIGLK